MVGWRAVVDVCMVITARGGFAGFLAIISRRGTQVILSRPLSVAGQCEKDEAQTAPLHKYDELPTTNLSIRLYAPPWLSRSEVPFQASYRLWLGGTDTSLRSTRRPRNRLHSLGQLRPHPAAPAPHLR